MKEYNIKEFAKKLEKRTQIFAAQIIKEEYKESTELLAIFTTIANNSRNK